MLIGSGWVKRLVPHHEEHLFTAPPYGTTKHCVGCGMELTDTDHWIDTENKNKRFYWHQSCWWQAIEEEAQEN